MKKIFIILLMLSPFVSIGQLVKGKVVDSKSGEPLSYANVVIVNSTIGVQCDSNGYFQLNITEGDSLRFIYVGYFKTFHLINLPKDKKEVNLGEIKLIDTGVAGHVTVAKKRFLSKKTKLKCVPFNDIKEVKPDDLVVHCYDGSISYKWDLTTEGTYVLDYQKIKPCEN